MSLSPLSSRPSQPRRETAGMLKGDKLTYQMDAANEQTRSAERSRAGVAEGADMVMVKPGLALYSMTR